MRASREPSRRPAPSWRPISLASFILRQRARECTLTGLRIMKPSLISFRTLLREFAFWISIASLGSSHTRARPQ
eukprot:gene1174-gene883